MPVVIADEDCARRRWLLRALAPLGRLVEGQTGAWLEPVVLGTPQPNLVLASATLPPPTGLQVLAAARASGSSVPFIIVLGYDGNRVQVILSDFRGTRVELHHLSAGRLLAVASELVEAHRQRAQ